MVKGYHLYPITQKDLHQELLRIGCDNEGVSIMAPRGLFHLIKLRDVPLRAALILKQEMLSKGGEAALPWQASALEVETCQVLLMGTERIFLQLLRVLPHQPFGLTAIGEKIKGLLQGRIPPIIKTNRGDLPLDQGPLIMGILNYTPDSFYDGGKYYWKEGAIRRALQIEEEGAELMDLGVESSRPGSHPLTLEEELDRILPVLEGVLAETSIPICIDSYKGGVAEEALKIGASIINDISGLHMDESLPGIAAKYKAPIIIMHMKGEPRTMQQDPKYKDLFGEMMDYLEEGIGKALLAGLNKDQIILDPGIGFGKTLHHNLQILRDLSSFKSLGYPLLVGPSRKSFIGKVLDLPVEDRLEGTAAAVALSIRNGANMVRVHDVMAMKRVVEMAYAIIKGCH